MKIRKFNRPKGDDRGYSVTKIVQSMSGGGSSQGGSADHAATADYASQAGEAEVAGNLRSDSSDWTTIAEMDAAVLEEAQEYAAENFLSKKNDDEAAGVITFKKGLLLGALGAWGWVKETVTGMSGTGWAWFKNLLADFAELAALSVTGDTNMEGNLTVENDLEVDGDTHLQNTTFGNFQQGQNGGGVVVNQDGTVTLYIDFLEVVKAAYFREITVRELKHVGGEIGLTAAAMVCIKVERISIGADVTTGQDIYVYKCYFETTDGKRSILNDFAVGDQALCQAANLREGTSQNVKTKYYWRLVTAVGDDYIMLSETDCAPNSGIPEAGDNIIQFGYRGTGAAASRRQSAIMMSATAADAPSITYYQGLGSDSRNYWEIAAYIVKEDGYSSQDGIMHSNTYGSLFIGDKSAYGVPDEQRTGKKFLEYTPTGGLKVQGDVSLSNGKTVEESISDVEDELEKATGSKFKIWFGEGTPTPNETSPSAAANEPASEWTTDSLKEEHAQDLYFDRSLPSGTAGRNWRWEAVTENDVTSYYWKEVTDQETIAALDLIQRTSARIDVFYDKIEAEVTEDGIVMAGMYMTAEGTVFDGKKVRFDTNAEFNGVVTENSAVVAHQDTAVTLVNMGQNTGMNAIRSVIVKAVNTAVTDLASPAASNHLVCLPFYDDGFALWSGDTEITFDAAGRFSLLRPSDADTAKYKVALWNQAGTRLTVANESDLFVNNWKAIEGWAASTEKTQYMNYLRSRAVLVCADPRLVCQENVDAGDSVAMKTFNQSSSPLWQPGRFSCGGYRARFIAILPGQTLRLRSQVVDVPTSQGQTTRHILIWEVENPEEFVPVATTVSIGSSSGEEIDIAYVAPAPNFTDAHEATTECMLAPSVLAGATSEYYITMDKQQWP